MVMSMIRVKVFSNFCTDEKMLTLIEKLYRVRKYKDLEFVTEDFTHAVIINTVMPILNISKENVLGLAFEPLQFLNITPTFFAYAKKHIKEYYIGVSSLPPPFKSHFSYMTFSQVPNDYLRDNYLKGEIPEKKGVISIWCSNKKQLFGHRYRHELIKKILEKNLPVDIWGSGCDDYVGKNVKGKFVFEPYKDYKYCITIENCETEDYISEKFLNCIALNTIPVYLGAKNIDRYFGDCSIKLTGEIEKDIVLIEDIIQNHPEKDLREARKKFFEEDLYFPEFLFNRWRV
jgi:hypothetical protein